MNGRCPGQRRNDMDEKILKDEEKNTETPALEEMFVSLETVIG